MADYRCGMKLAETTAQLFSIFESQDFDELDQLVSPDLLVKQNNNPEHGLDGLMAFVQGLRNDGVAIEYSDVRRSVGDDFVVEQHLVTLTRPDGVSATSDVCVVLRFDADGRVVRLDEYADPGAFAGLIT